MSTFDRHSLVRYIYIMYNGRATINNVDS